MWLSSLLIISVPDEGYSRNAYKLNQSNIEANIDPLGILSLTLKARNYPNISQALL
jgi:hypothetical protein